MTIYSLCLIYAQKQIFEKIIIIALSLKDLYGNALEQINLYPRGYDI